MKDNKPRRNYGGRMMSEESIAKAKARSQKYRDANADKINEKARAKSREPERRAKVQAYRDKNKSRQQEYCKEYYSKNRDHLLDSASRYYENNRDKKIAYQGEYSKRRMKEDPVFKLTCYMRSRVRNVIYNQFASKKCSTFKLVGCNPTDLKTHLESQFTEGMTWDNYGKWHVDHIKPCASFNLALDSDQTECFHYSNLQPLWAEDNIRKSDNYE